MSSFKKFKDQVQQQANLMTKNNRILYITDVDKNIIYEMYQEAFPTGTNEIYKERREYDCNSCKSFIKRFGNVVAIQNNELVSVWDIENLEHPFNVVAKQLSELVKFAPIRNIFVADQAKLGTDHSVSIDSGKSTTWHHLYCEVPKSFVATKEQSIEAKQATFRDPKNVFERSMKELTVSAGETALELIDQDALYRGQEYRGSIEKFLSYKQQYDKLEEKDKENWCWVNSLDNPVVKIRNTAIGTLLVDLSEDMELDQVVGRFKKVMDPNNFHRPNPVYTKKTIDAFEKKIEELGLKPSLPRRFAVLEDITVNNVLYVNRDARKKMTTSIFDELRDSVPVSTKNLDKVDTMNIKDFLSKILPTTTNLELMLDSSHEGNFMSLIAPVNKDAPCMLKWDNNYSWSYNGDITDSMKQRVKNAGGDIDGVLRFSIQWNDNKDNSNDYDAHCIEPSGNKISFMSKTNSLTSGKLDVDIQRPTTEVAVENITWTNLKKMREGVYTFIVHNYHHRGGTSGFTAEIEYGGEIYSFSYNKDLKNQDQVVVAKVKFSRKTGIEFLESLDTTSRSSREVWSVKTNNFTRVSTVMFSPNHWDDQQGNGNLHYFFFLEGCKNENKPRGFFNEFLRGSLNEHRKIFEALGSKMRVEDSDEQLSGVGFSSTQRNSVIAKVEGNFTRTLKIEF